MNRLAQARSPYLRQHATNPVDWYPWGEEALDRARELDRPLLVSVGYAACHWCHVMAHESFEDPAIAKLMNADFVCVKVDREQSPEIDAVCMDACLALNGHGGWPLNVFFTPEQRPFFAGTYFPPADRPGMPGFATVLGAIAEAWRTRPDELRTQGARLSEAIAEAVTLPARTEIELPREVIAHATTALTQTFDRHSGGWGRAPLFPAHCTLDFLLNVAAAHPDPMIASAARDTALASLTAMASGGIYDQLGGGFHRYSVDGHWTVPHFEKMLYDNALLARAYLHGWQLSGEGRLLAVATATLDFAIRELQGPEGGFCSSLDADSDGGEGAFYVWTPAQIKATIDDPNLAALVLAHFQVTDSGNFEGGASVLTASAGATATAEQLDEIRARLLAARAQRPRPARDDKRLTGWNALILMALADAGAVLGREDYLRAASDCAQFLATELREPGGRLKRSWLEGRAELPAQLDDYAYLLQALIVLYESTFDVRHYHAAIETAEQLLEQFAAPDGGFFTTVPDQPTLISRRKDAQDAPIPSGNAAAALGLLRLAQLTGEARYEQAAVSVLAMLGEMAARQPSGFAHLLSALDLYLAPAKQVALIGDHGAGPLASAYRQRLRPHAVLAGTADLVAAADDPLALLRERSAIEGRPTAYVCQNFACHLPVTEVAEFMAELEG